MRHVPLFGIEFLDADVDGVMQGLDLVLGLSSRSLLGGPLGIDLGDLVFEFLLTGVLVCTGPGRVKLCLDLILCRVS
jgi:hypothetical protein